MAIRAFTEPGDAVLIQRPVYYPFSSSIEDNDRCLINSPLIYTGGRYEMDLEDFERKIVDEQVKLFILCSPHNPVGRVWREEELLAVGEICRRHGVLVLADEIHADFVFAPNRHHIFAGLRPEFEDFTITCTAPSKTFNLAGLQISNIFIPNEQLRQHFCREIAKTGYDEPSRMGLIASAAAYAGGGEWFDALLGYLEGNRDYVRSELARRIPEIRLVEPESTYLLWLDCRALGFDERGLTDFIVNRAKLWLDEGTLFGPEGSGFERVNIACPRATLAQALDRLERACRG